MPAPPGGGGGGARWGLLLVWGAVGGCVLLPLGAVVVRTLGGVGALGGAEVMPSPAGLAALGRSAGYAGLIATLATVLAWPVAVAASRARAAWLVVVGTPMLLPAYLAYAGWSIARAPTTPLGRLIGAAPERGMEWLPMLVGRGLAVWGLALWAWPLAAVVIAAGLRAVDAQIGESLRLERVGPLGRARTLGRAAWPSVAAGWALVALVMLGSAVPLHVARVETYAIRVWMALDEHPGEPWRAWVVAWPLVAVAAAAGWVLSGRLAGAGRRLALLAADETRPQRVGLGTLAAAGVAWVLAVVVPFGLFWSSMGGVGAIGRLIDRAGAGLATSGGVGAAVGAGSAVLALGAAQATGAARGRLGSLRVALAIGLAWALVPGVLVGAAVAQFVRVLPEAVGDSVAPMVLAHLSRVAFLPVLVGAWVGSSEAGGIAEARLVDGALGVASWVRTSLRSALGPALGVGFACGCLSFHEIESSVQVQTPGIDHMAQRLLQWLHYERMAELSAAGVLLLGVGILVGIGVSAGVLIAGGWSRSRTLDDPGR
ncbi:MAG: hypothetical protein IT431_06320 [Phycisphaerales bacterium]|nr:hypothetical protein [Phycisphaerales bacterium]